ncbi:LysR family transcriptional regulator [Mycolicibacterium litorale]|uniref:Probable hydrogen peroxide-inducible genes activator n=1 Tax=Mycolicibacterium litorale TaxID=758802 RepID=A0AAD1IQ15_9MYCO|nr:LysR family transcriptional regulator [Mycolicibacterium litorale]MCV7414150.1 LysR family transcriptional regulator [Mycolicibacterium litorale]TDY02158.1 LysR family transcriptional regulator [Mycolicibacterium litorale]BBY15663.1 LysR family transcriptional regulator [Mycolicibacterium litorale]
MELRQLEYFVAVAEEANFTRAAQRVHVAQPAVSAQVARLERELGQPLLDRARRQVRLTAAGAAVLPHAQAALAAVADARVAVEELAGLVRGCVVIGTVTAHNVDMPALLADFHAAHPGVEITLSTADSDRLVEGVRSGGFDLVIASVGADEVPDGLEVEVTTDEAIDAAVGLDDPWRDVESVPVTALAERSLIALPEGTGLRRRLGEAFASAGRTPRIAFEASTPQELADLAARGLGVAIVPQSVARHRADLHAVAITPELRGRLVLAWRAGGPVSPAARALIGMARERLRVTGDA